MSRIIVAALAAVLLLAAPSHAVVTAGIEDYADWQPQTRCAPKAKPGTKVLGRWIVHQEGGAFAHHLSHFLVTQGTPTEAGDEFTGRSS